MQEPDQMATYRTETQQQKFNPKNQQDDINRLLNAVLSNGIYQAAAGGTFPKGNTNDRANYQKTRISISGSCGKHVPFSFAADLIPCLLLKHWIIFCKTIQPGFFSASGNLPTMNKVTNLHCDVLKSLRISCAHH